MKDSSPNHYERAFENWLLDHRIEYVRPHEHKRIGPGRGSIKNFDFLLLPRPDRRIVTEVKGRTFRGTSLVGLKGFECWVTRDDVKGLQTWRAVLGADHEAIFAFAYRVDNVDVDFDGQDVFDCGRDRYLFFCVRIDDYCRHMKRRSPKWQTVTLSAEKFRQCAISLSAFLL